MPKMHDLKTWPGPFRDIKAGRKTFEYRRDDRDYQEGDSLRLREWTSMRGYVRRERLNGESPAALVGL